MKLKTIQIGHQIFKILRLLGKGKSGYSYLVECGQERYTLKQMHNEPCSYYTFGDKLQSELQAYSTLSDIGIRMPRLVEYNEEQRYLVKEFIDGPTIAAQVAAGASLKEEIRQVIHMAEQVAAYKINIDYFPTNFMVSQGELSYIDYELNAYSDEWNFANWGIYYWVNQKGMDNFLKTGDSSKINLPNSYRPIKEPFVNIVKNLITTLS